MGSAFNQFTVKTLGKPLNRGFQDARLGASIKSEYMYTKRVLSKTKKCFAQKITFSHFPFTFLLSVYEKIIGQSRVCEPIQYINITK